MKRRLLPRSLQLPQDVKLRGFQIISFSAATSRKRRSGATACSTCSDRPATAWGALGACDARREGR